MTQERDDVRKIAEFNALFLTLDDKGQDDALAILRSLGFAQSTMYSLKQDELPHEPPENIDNTN